MTEQLPPLRPDGLIVRVYRALLPETIRARIYIMRHPHTGIEPPRNILALLYRLTVPESMRSVLYPIRQQVARAIGRNSSRPPDLDPASLPVVAQVEMIEGSSSPVTGDSDPSRMPVQQAEPNDNPPSQIAPIPEPEPATAPSLQIEVSPGIWVPYASESVVPNHVHGLQPIPERMFVGNPPREQLYL
jgi:hypothetical protein